MSIGGGEGRGRGQESQGEGQAARPLWVGGSDRSKLIASWPRGGPALLPRLAGPPGAGVSVGGGHLRGALPAGPCRQPCPSGLSRGDAATSRQSSQDDTGPSEHLGAGLISGTVSWDQGQEFQENCSCG